jgi:drug/metabolite transporter (DMT)-like permease
MTPVVSVVTATLWLGERPTLSLLAAIVLILGGVALGATGSPTGRRDGVGRPVE